MRTNWKNILGWIGLIAALVGFFAILGSCGGIEHGGSFRLGASWVQAALRGPNVLPMDVCYFATSMNGRAQAWGWIGNHVFCY